MAVAGSKERTTKPTKAHERTIATFVPGMLHMAYFYIASWFENLFLGDRLYPLWLRKA
jgi:hypothetical protein